MTALIVLAAEPVCSGDGFYFLTLSIPLKLALDFSCRQLDL